MDLNLFGLGLVSVSTSPGLGLDKGGLDYSPGFDNPFLLSTCQLLVLDQDPLTSLFNALGISLASFFNMLGRDPLASFFNLQEKNHSVRVRERSWVGLKDVCLHETRETNGT